VKGGMEDYSDVCQSFVESFRVASKMMYAKVIGDGFRVVSKFAALKSSRT
jgi:hypothetical protein